MLGVIREYTGIDISEMDEEIGRASCRERVQISVVAGALKKKKEKKEKKKKKKGVKYEITKEPHKK